MKMTKIIVEDATLLLKRIGGDMFKIEIDGIKTDFKGSYEVFIGETITVKLPPMITEISDT